MLFRISKIPKFVRMRENDLRKYKGPDFLLDKERFIKFILRKQEEESKEKAKLKTENAQKVLAVMSFIGMGIGEEIDNFRKETLKIIEEQMKNVFGEFIERLYEDLFAERLDRLLAGEPEAGGNYWATQLKTKLHSCLVTLEKAIQRHMFKCKTNLDNAFRKIEQKKKGNPNS